MKNLFFAVFGFVSLMSYAQNNSFKAGAHLGLPVNGTEDFAKLSTGIDLTYLYAFSEKFSMGATTGFTTFLGKRINEQFTSPDVTVIPLAVSTEYKLFHNFRVGADVGVVLGVGNIDNGYFYYHPKVVYGFNKIDLQLGYRSFIDFQTLSFGFAYKF